MNDEKRPDEKKAPPAPPAPTGDKRAVEYWAEKHGMLPEVHGGGALALPTEVRGQRSVRVSMAMSGKVAPRHNPRYVEFYAAKLHNNWVTGHEVTEDEFLAACEKAYGPKAEVVCR